jgi:hypothetical protein
MRAESTFPADRAQPAARSAQKRPPQTAAAARRSPSPRKPFQQFDQGLALTRSHRDDHLSEPSNGSRA